MEPDELNIEREREKIRQQKETFDQRKKQDRLWFILKLVMGGFSILLLTGVFLISSYVLYYHEQYNSRTITLVGTVLLVDIVGLMAAVWKIVLSPDSITKLEPVIKDKE